MDTHAFPKSSLPKVGEADDSNKNREPFRARVSRAAKVLSHRMRRSALFLVAPVVLIISLGCWISLEPSPSLTTIAEALVKEGAPYAFLAIAASLVLACGYVDLSQAGVLAACGVIFATISNLHLPLWFNIVISLFVGAGIGFITGFVVSRQIDALIFTWAIGSILLSASIAWAGLRKVRGQETGVNFESPQGIWNLGGHAFIMALGALFVCLLLLIFSNLPRHCCAVGANSQSARFAGVNVSATIIKAYFVAGLLVATASIFECYRESKALTVRTGSVELMSITIAVLGGTSMKGGQLNLLSVAGAAALWASIQRQLLAIDFSSHRWLAWIGAGQQTMATQAFFSILLIGILFFGRKVWRERTRVIRVID